MINLKKIRESKNIKQSEVANYLNITTSAYSRYETGVRNPDPDTLVMLADFFNVSVDYLLGRIDIQSNFDSLKIFTDDTISIEDFIEKFNININGQQLSKKDIELILHAVKNLGK